MTDTEHKTPAPRLDPVITLDAKFFWDHAAKGEFVAQRCSGCGSFRFPPRPMCPECHALEPEIVPLSGRGRVYSFIRPQHPKAVGFAEPPVVAVIELEEGVRLVSNVDGVPFEDMQAGMAVEVSFAPTMKGKQVPVFKPVEAR